MLTTEYCDIHAITDYVQAGAGVAGILNGAKIIFGTNPLVEGKLKVPADIVQSVDAGLAPHTVTWGAAARDAAGDIVSLTVTVPVQLADSANTCTLTCWGLTDAGGTHLLLCEALRLTEEMNLADNLTLYNVQVPFCPSKPAAKRLVILS